MNGRDGRKIAFENEAACGGNAPSADKSACFEKICVISAGRTDPAELAT